jgi:hypothetical protein
MADVTTMKITTATRDRVRSLGETLRMVRHDVRAIAA